MAGDHGIVAEGVSAYPQDVTWQMVMNFVQGGAAINVFCKQHSITLHVIDAGVNYGFNDHIDGIINSKIAAGTKNFAYEPAMSHQQVAQAIEAGARIVKIYIKLVVTLLVSAEMGIGNTSSASVIMSLICNIPIEDCVGKGTGLDDHGLQHKIDVLRNAIARHSDYDTPENILATFGGFEIAQMVGGMLQAAELNMIYTYRWIYYNFGLSDCTCDRTRYTGLYHFLSSIKGEGTSTYVALPECKTIA